MTRPLTQRERDVLRYKAEGRSDYDISAALRITESAVHNATLRAIRAIGAIGARTLDQAIQIHNQPEPNGDQK
ncbi:LuxR C-terminal-related transcriptional regulator [Kitasatospora sp. NPDC088556]|uniref:LuxR C-terminal-related transcriptional regulator n=1 Tax=Kitasatospora sp. NPDC088556 TaxID=3364076 RepID=UPI003809F239